MCGSDFQQLPSGSVINQSFDLQQQPLHDRSILPSQGCGGQPFQSMVECLPGCQSIPQPMPCAPCASGALLSHDHAQNHSISGELGGGDSHMHLPSLPSRLPCYQPDSPLRVHTLFEDTALALGHQEGDLHTECHKDQLSHPPSQSQIVEVPPQTVVEPKQNARRATVLAEIGDDDLPVKPALIRMDNGTVLSANVVVQSRVVEWEWGRAAAAMELKTEKASQLLTRNREHHTIELMEAEISQDQVFYRGAGDDGKGYHGFGSSAFILMMMLVALTRQNTKNVKLKALSLAVGLLKLAVANLTTTVAFAGIVYGKDSKYHDKELVVDSSGIVANLHFLLMQHPGCTFAWGKCMSQGFCDFKTTSAITHPTLWDLLILCVWAKGNPSVKKVWVHFGQFIWPKLMFAIGTILDKYAFVLSERPVESLPLVKSKKGKSRRVPWMNKLLLLRKIKHLKHHRKHAASSHGDVVPVSSQTIRAEDFVVSSLYALQIKKAYEHCYHFTVSWDPSSYDVETLVSIVFSWQAGLASYLPIQNLRPAQKTEVDPEILALASKNKLTRVQGYNEIRALSHSLMAINMPLQKFVFPEDLLWQPLSHYETRLWKDDQWYVVNSRTGQVQKQIPDNFNILKTPILVSLSDQGGINRSGLDYLVHKKKLSIHVQFDPYHRGWNDVKLCLKASRLFKCFLSFSLLWNCNYGPFNSREWHQKKEQELRTS